MMDSRKQEEATHNEAPDWEQPDVLEEGVIEAKLFSDEPDPWGGP